MKQSPNDHKSYEALTLANGLRVLLINNNESDKAAAALAVNAGHFDDPKDRQGLAHFLEHMLFLGTEKYPDGSEYQKFISQHGGHNNAWTGTEHTCFFFDINHAFFEQALDRFSDFFISPLLSESFVQSERMNIDAEFKMKLKDDIRRLYDVHKQTINQQHPFAQFSVGNIETLADHPNKPVQRDVIEFFNQHYYAQAMTLAVEGPFPHSVLKRLVEEKFSSIVSHKTPQKKITTPLYLPEHLGQEISVIPVKNERQVIVSFAMPSIDEYYQHKPESLLAYLFGHEGPGSLLSHLKSKQWAMALTAGSGINGSNFKDFNISIRLTPLGENHVNDIIELVFSYIQLLRSQSIDEFYYQEKQALAELAFEYQEKLKPLDSVSQLVTNMQHYPVEDYIYGDYIMTGMCHQTIDFLTGFFTANNCRIIRISQTLQANSESFWYKVPYSVNKISEDILKLWNNASINKALYLPAKNDYIVSSPKVYSHDKETQIPSILLQEVGISVWYKQDTTFKVPKGYIYIGIDSPHSVTSVTNIAMTKLFVDLYSDAVIEKYYDAELAGIHYHLYAHQGGVTLQLSGICAKQPLLLTKLLEDLQHFKPSEQHFNLIKEQLINHWDNADQSKSISQLFSTLSSLMQPNNPSSSNLCIALSKVTFKDFINFSKMLFDEVAIEALIHGNWLENQAIKIAALISNTFSNRYHSNNKVECPVIDIENKQELLIPVHMPAHDHAAVIYYPHENKDLQSTALIMLISHLLAPLFFEEMRTEKQYGYLVNVGYIPINRYPGLAFYIQSPNILPEMLVNEMNQFIDHWRSKVTRLPEEQWQTLKHGLASQLLERDASLRIKSQRFWGAICNQDTDFDHKQKIIDAILSVERKDLESFISTSQPLASKQGYKSRITLISTQEEIHDFLINNQLKGEIIDEYENFTHKSKRKF